MAATCFFPLLSISLQYPPSVILALSSSEHVAVLTVPKRQQMIKRCSSLPPSLSASFIPLSSGSERKIYHFTHSKSSPQSTMDKPTDWTHHHHISLRLSLLLYLLFITHSLFLSVSPSSSFLHCLSDFLPSLFTPTFTLFFYWVCIHRHSCSLFLLIFSPPQLWMV